MNRDEPVRPIAIQMWTVRSEAEKSLPATLQRLEQLGYDAIETAGLYGLSPVEFAALLDDTGLELASAHQPLPSAEDAEKVFTALSQLGAKTAFCSLSEEHWRTEEAINRAVDRINEVVDIGAAFDIGFGYHNHWWEFTHQVGGQPAYETFLQRLDPRAAIEVDTYWVEAGGGSATDVVARLGERTHHLHIKDGPGDRASAHVAVGQGSLDIPAILRANPAVEWHIVELDEYDGDIWDAVSGSVEYLASVER